MAIKIIEEPTIHLTRAEHDRLHREWEASQSMTAMPVDFETYVRQRQRSHAQLGVKEQPHD